MCQETLMIKKHCVIMLMWQIPRGLIWSIRNFNKRRLNAFDSSKLTGVIKFIKKSNDTVQQRQKDSTKERVNAPACVVAYNKYSMYGQCWQCRPEEKQVLHTDKVTTLVPFFWDGKCLHFTPAFTKPQGITELDFHLELLNRLNGTIHHARQNKT